MQRLAKSFSPSFVLPARLALPADNPFMQRLQAFRFELMPDGRQQRDMRHFDGACRFVYNSQTCPHCAHVSHDNRRTQAAFVRPAAMATMPMWSAPSTFWSADCACQPVQRTALAEVERHRRNQPR